MLARLNGVALGRTNYHLVKLTVWPYLGHLQTAVSQLAKEKSALTASVTKAEDSVQALTEAKESLEGQLTTLTETKESLATERDALRKEAALNKENIAR